MADESHEKYVDLILETIRIAAKKRGTGIAERTHEYVATKMKEGKAVIALDSEDNFAGFSYIETWGNKHYVTTSGLIVHPDYQGLGIAKRIKDYTFTLARIRWPKAKIFSLTSGDAVMKMNTALGYVPVSFNQLTDDDAFWRGCEGCVNHDILVSRPPLNATTTFFLAISLIINYQLSIINHANPLFASVFITSWNTFAGVGSPLCFSGS